MTGFKAFEQGIPAEGIRSQRDAAKQQQRCEHILRQLRESEILLDVLRPISPTPRRLDRTTIERFMKATADVRQSPDFHDDGQDGHLIDPRGYFIHRYPEQIKKYGPVFFGSDIVWDRRQIFVTDALNDLTFAAILGTPCLGCQVVYFPSEAQWYCSDYRIDGAYFPTSEEKLGILISHYFIQCSQHCHKLAGKAVLMLRTPQTIKNVITTAKAMLEVEKSFFTGKDGHRRYVDGKFIEPTEEPSYQVFVKKAIIAEPQGKVTVHDAFHRYYQFCRDNQMTPLTRQEFKSLVSEVIRAIFNVGLRHDIIGDNNKQGHGWCGITYRQEFAECLGRN